MFTEFGADAVAGMHAQPPEMWTEEYQADMIEMYLRVLDDFPFIFGAHPWAFADFRTSQSIMRIGALNHKGVFTARAEAQAGRPSHPRPVGPARV